MPGPAPKPAERRQWRGRADVGLVKGSSVLRVAPAAPKGLLVTTKAAWVAFWESPVSSLVDQRSDMPALVRLFGFYDDVERLRRAFKKSSFVKGSQGQPVLNPAMAGVTSLLPEIRALETNFGLSPMARLKLGVTFGDAVRSLDELNEATLVEIDLDDGPDPRVIDVG